MWWIEQFGWELKSSTCSDILSAKWAHLDTDTDKPPLSVFQLQSQIIRRSKWTTLEAALIECRSDTTNILILALQLATYYDIKQQSSGLSILNTKVLCALYGQKDGLQGSRRDML